MTLAILTMAAALVPPTWIDIHPLFAGEEERTAADVARLVETTPVQSVAWCCTLVPEGDPAAPKGEIYASRIRRHVAALRARTEAPWGILFQATVGHGWAPNCPTPGQKVIDADGKEWYKFCPLATNLVSYVAAQARALAATHPDFFMVDDDTRLITSFGGCYCPLHLAEMARRTGRAWTRETLIAAMKREPALAATYDTLLSDSFVPLMRAIRAAFPAETPGTFCCCNLDAHHAYRMASLVAAPGQKPVIRINNAVYMIGNRPLEIPRIVSMTAREIADIRGAATLLTEADTCPHNRFSLSGEAYVNHIVMTLLEGCAGAKMWVTNLSNPYERRSAESYRATLARTKGLVETVAALGLRRTGLVIPLPKTRPAGVPLTDRPVDWSTAYLARAGLPYRFGQPGAEDVAVLSGPDLRYFSDAELAHLLEGRVLLDGGAAMGLAARGFGPLIGVEAKAWTKETICAERFGTRLFRTAIVPAADLSARVAGASVHSTLLHSTSELTDDWRELAPGSLYFENARGGRVFTFAAVLPKPPARLMQWYYFNETRKEAILRAVRMLAGVKALPAYYAGDAEILCETGVSKDGHGILVFDNLGIDDEDSPEIGCAGDPSEIARLGDDGVWRPVVCERTASGTYRLRSIVRTLRPAVFRYTLPERSAVKTSCP